jgi:nucleoside 2-deoxyribosyltransferase
MKIYLAATFSEQARMRKYRDKLFLMGHNVLSTWLNEIVKPDNQTSAQFGLKMADKDLREIAEADCLILDRLVPSTSGGKMIEYGAALILHKLLYVVEPNMTDGCIFLRKADGIFDTWEQLLEHLDAVH